LKSHVDPNNQSLYILIIEARDNPGANSTQQQQSDSLLVRINVTSTNTIINNNNNNSSSISSILPNKDTHRYFIWPGTAIKTSKSFLNYMLLLFAVAFLGLILITGFILLICCCMRHNYKQKLRTEKAINKAFGMDGCNSDVYADAFSGYINSAFDSTSQIPGTNLYAYEGSNPIWLKKYDKIEMKSGIGSNRSGSSSNSSDQLTPSTSAASSIVDSTQNRSNQELITSSKSRDNNEISSFFLTNRHIVDVSPNSMMSPSSSVQFINQQSSLQRDAKMKQLKLNNTQNISSFKTIDTLLTFASNNTSMDNKYQQQQQKKQQQQHKTSNGVVFSINSQRKPLPPFPANHIRSLESSHQFVLPNSFNNYTKIFDSNDQMTTNETNNMMTTISTFSPNYKPNQLVSKELSDLFVVESTVI
jgi:hypothetical protein